MVGQCVCTCWLVQGLSTFSGQLLHQEHEQGADLWLIAVQKGLVANLSLVAKVLQIKMHVNLVMESVHTQVIDLSIMPHPHPLEHEGHSG